MSKETTITVCKETLKVLKGYKKEFGFKNLDESVQNSVRWARLFNYVDSEQRRTMIERINTLEFRITALEKFVVEE